MKELIKLCKFKGKDARLDGNKTYLEFDRPYWGLNLVQINIQ